MHPVFRRGFVPGSGRLPMYPEIGRVRLICRTSASLAVGTRRGAANVNPALDFIPGTSLRGALARTMLAWPEAERDWNALLSSLSFPDLTPDGAVPAPLSAKSCKFGRGFF